MGKLKVKETVKSLKVIDKASVAGQRIINGADGLKATGSTQKQGSTTAYASEHVERVAKGAAKNRVYSGARAARYAGRTASKLGKRVYGNYKIKKWVSANSAGTGELSLPGETPGGSVKYISPRSSRFKGLGKRGLKVMGRLARPVRQMKGRGELLLDNTSRSTNEYAIQNVQNEMKNLAKNRVYSGGRAARYAGRTALKVWRAGQSGGKAASAASNAMKGGQKTLKTVNRTSSLAMKATGKSVTTAKKSARNTVRTSRMVARAVGTIGRGSIAGLKALLQSSATALKAILAGTKAVVAALAAGGSVAVITVVILCVVGLIAGSFFGIFFSNADAGDAMTLQQVVQEINQEYQDELDNIKTSVTHDVLEMSGSRAVWPEVLSVYSVKTTTDPENPQEVATMDEQKKQLLEDMFWSMNQIDHRTESKTETELVETDDGNGNILEEEVTVTNIYLYITVSHKTAEEMVQTYHFDQEQKEMVAELLDDGNASMWTSVLYGIGASDDQIVAVALSQVGNVGGEPYWSWYGFSTHVDWCACFVSWCANECGYIENGVIPKFAGCHSGADWFKERGQWADNSIEPAPGTLIFFDWDEPQDGLPNHVGIVEKVEDGRVYTIEGNSGDMCRQNSYPIGYYEILGYGLPAY